MAWEGAFLCEFKGRMLFEMLSRSEPPSIALKLGVLLVELHWTCWRRSADNYFLPLKLNAAGVKRNVG